MVNKGQEDSSSYRWQEFCLETTEKNLRVPEDYVEKDKNN